MKITKPASKQPIPENAKLVFKGVVFDTYQWEVNGYDGSKRIFEKVKRPDTAMIIPVTEDGKIILALQEQPNKLPFMGTVEDVGLMKAKMFLEAAKRELLEETGYEAKNWFCLF